LFLCLTKRQHGELPHGKKRPPNIGGHRLIR
jgi:hypothetical protein